jgi:hypothetical protein
MGGVDLFDQMSGSYSYPHKVQKWYQAIYHFMKEAALVNARTLYIKDNLGTKKFKDGANFRRSVAEALCDSLPTNKFVKIGRRSTDTLESKEARLKDRHFPMRFEDIRHKPNCVVCSNSTAHPGRRQTSFACM